MNKHNKLILFYLFGVLCLYRRYVSIHSSIVSEFLIKAERASIDASFGVFVIFGLLKLFLLVVGSSLLIIPSVLLVVQFWKKRKT